MAIAIDADRLVCESGLLGRNTVVDKNGREWQVVVFRGDDLAFRLRFRKAAAHPATVVVLTRGEGTDEKIDVSCITDVLARNEGGDPLDLSVPAFFKRLCPKINFPPLELRRHKDALLARLESPCLARIDGIDVFQSVLMEAAHRGLEPGIEHNRIIGAEEIAHPIAPAGGFFFRA
jgi:hypothetical protein